MEQVRLAKIAIGLNLWSRHFNKTALVQKVIIQNSIVLSTQLKLSVDGKWLLKTTTTYANTLRFSSW
jgi:hypothetical protein